MSVTSGDSAIRLNFLSTLLGTSGKGWLDDATAVKSIVTGRWGILQ
jgi:hypothetical protein